MPLPTRQLMIFHPYKLPLRCYSPPPGCFYPIWFYLSSHEANGSQADDLWPGYYTYSICFTQFELKTLGHQKEQAGLITRTNPLDGVVLLLSEKHMEYKYPDRTKWTRYTCPVHSLSVGGDASAEMPLCNSRPGRVRASMGVVPYWFFNQSLEFWLNSIFSTSTLGGGVAEWTLQRWPCWKIVCVAGAYC